jgi:mono/diheme cytochrome c family protein
MKRVMSAVIAALLLLAGTALARDKAAEFDFGKHEFEAKCADCHGTTGRGDGVNKAWLERSPSDLTRMAKAHGGEFPYMHFYAVVDGRFERGATDMPCFADVYAASAAEDYMDVEYETDRYLDTRLVALADYVAGLQAR